ncbi:MAG: hypothetical protein EOL90_13630 [Spartobacteria bacterium]|nr:hypothetical protein [Spartobacteria bacterium]
MALLSQGIQISGDQGFFLAPAPAFQLAFAAHRFHRGGEFLLVDHLVGRMHRRMAGAGLGAVAGKSFSTLQVWPT